MNGRRYIIGFVLAAIIRLGWLFSHAGFPPEGNYGRFDQGDYRLYEIGAEHIAAQGDFNNSLFLVRPPGFPLLIYAVGISQFAVLIANCFFGAGLVPLSMKIALELGLRLRLALWVGLILCLDPTAVIHSSVSLYAEPMTNAAILIFILCLLLGVKSAERRNRYSWLIAAAIFLAISALTRPTTQWLWVISGGLLWWQRPRLRRSVIAFTLTSSILLSGWVVHNGFVHRHYIFSTLGAYTMLYYRAASVERLATNQPILDVFAAINQRVAMRMGDSPEGIGEEQRHHWLAATPEVHAAMVAESLSIFLKYPIAYLLTVPVGFLRIFGIFSAFPLLSQPWLSLAWLWDICLVLGWCAGMIFAKRAQQKPFFWWQITIVGYTTVVTLIVSSASNSARMTSSITPFLIMALVYALDEIRILHRKRSSLADSAGSISLQ
ncbi:MAG: phospholipid carrier-dependent glycosyltransferase [Anaerolineaceae bacterium]|nr:phospholipid carrier-dependent glycosyltransferase [Anaerolineaceae bacterium]